MRVKADGATLNGFIDKGSHFQGDLSFEETFRIDGHFEGRIRSGSELIVGDGAEVSAQIEVERISINGTLKGSVHASGRIELLARARVYADLATPALRIEEGAFFQGSCQMGEGRANLFELNASTRKT
ncbi:MAG TPA: polymer-forming cytoskeletal protein [Thermoanaerobaculia bacterium]